MDEAQLEVETFVLKGVGVVDPAAFAASHPDYLVSIRRDPGEAARWWNWQADQGFPGEGWVSIKLNDAQIMPPDAWTNVGLFWGGVLDAVEGYGNTGFGRGDFSEERAGFSVAEKGPLAIFELRGDRYPVEPSSFLRGLLDAAREFYSWAGRYTRECDPSALTRIKELAEGMLR